MAELQLDSMQRSPMCCRSSLAIGVGLLEGLYILWTRDWSAEGESDDELVP
jgi:hypothetical protein